LQSLLFIIYLILFCWLITRIPFFVNAGIQKGLLIAILLLKIVSGFAYSWFFAQPQYIQLADTWNYFHASLAETDWLLHDPVAFVKDLFQYSYRSSGNLFNDQSSYWNDLKSNFIIKLIAVVNVFTGKSYYVNIIFFNFLYLFGPVALYRLATTYRTQPKLPLILFAFMLPSFLFWCSGIHKDGLIFSAMLLSMYSINKQLHQGKILISHCLLMLFYFIVIFALRNFVVLLLIPGLAAWILSEKYPSRKGWVFSGIYLICIVVFFSLKYINPSLNFPQYVVEKQAAFNELPGNSRIALPPLVPSLMGFAIFFPYAIDMAFLEPHWNDVKNLYYFAAATENALLLLLMIIGAISAFRHKKVLPFTLFLLFFSCSLLLLSGYTVTFAGAVIRYKSIATPLLATAICMLLRPDNLKFKDI